MSVQSIHAFAEKVALVTDGASPIGRAVSLQLALQGSFVIVAFSDAADEYKGALAEMQSLGTLAKAVEADITTPDGIAKLISEVGSSFGRLDLLVNCLKYLPQSSFEDSGELDFDTVVGSNFKAAYLVTNACLPLMADRPKPRIVNVFTRETSENAPLYEAMQSAVEGFTKSLARTLPAKFRVNAVASTAAKSVREGFDPELLPMAGTAAADDTARAVLYLLSPEAVGINGQVLEVAG
ncbi:MAG: SDR family oxidoreductase [Acidobacteriota bacterium]